MATDTLLGYESFELPSHKEIVFFLTKLSQELQTRFLNIYNEIAQLKSAADITAYFQGKASESQDSYYTLMTGLLYGILTNTERKEEYFNYVSLITRDSYQTFIELLEDLALGMFEQFKDKAKDNFIWTFERLSRVPHVTPKFVDLLLVVMRLIPHAASKLPKIVHFFKELVNALLVVLENSIELAFKSPSTPLVFFKVVKLIGEAYREDLETLRGRYEKIAVKIWHSRKEDCKEIGCELIRILQNVSRVAGLEQIFKDLAVIEANGKPAFWNMLNSPNKRTGGNEYLNLSIPLLVEEKLTHIMLKTDIQSMSRYVQWVLNDAGIGEGNEEEQLVLADWVRYIVVNLHVVKLMTPRWYLIGWLLNYTKHQHARAQIKLALFFDWLFFGTNMGHEPYLLLEPGIQLIVYSIKEYHNITEELLDFLLVTAENYDIQRKSLIQANVRNAFDLVIRKQIIKSLDMIYDSKIINSEIKARLRAFLAFPTSTPAPATLPVASPMMMRPFEPASMQYMTEERAPHIPPPMISRESVTPLDITNALLEWSGKEVITQFLERPNPTQLTAFIQKYAEDVIRVQNAEKMKVIEDSLIDLLKGALKESIMKAEDPKSVSLVNSLVEFAATHTGEKITIEGKQCFRFIHKLCQSDTFIASYIFYAILLKCNEISSGEVLANYKTLFRALWDIKSSAVLESLFVQQSSQFEYDVVGEELAILAKYFDHYIRDNIGILKMLVQTCKYSQLHKVELAVQYNGSRLIERSILSIAKQSLEWSSYDQILLWKIINAHPTNAFQTKENLIHCLCYLITTLPHLEGCMEFLDGVFSFFSRHFGGQKEPEIEELGYVFGLGLMAKDHIYRLIGSMQPKQITGILQKMMDMFINKQESKKLKNTLELMGRFVEIEEKVKGNVVGSIKEDRAFKVYLKGVLQSAGSQIPPKTYQALTALLKS